MHNTAINTTFALVVLACLMLSGCGMQNPDPKSTQQSNSKSDIKPIVKLDNRKKSKQINKEWLKLLHRSEEGVNWKDLEHQNTLNRLKKFEGSKRSSGMVSVAGGKLSGTWQEMGPSNLAGDIKRVAYSKNQDRIYAISSGNTLWRGKIDGSEWQVVDDTRRFDYDLLEVVDFPNGNTRILAAINNVPHFTEDGNLWSMASGFNQSSETEQMLITAQNEVFILAKHAELGTVQLMHSSSESGISGKAFTMVKEFPTIDFKNIAIALNQDQTNLYLVELLQNESKIKTYFWSRTQQELIPTATYGNASESHFTEDKAILTAQTLNQYIVLTIVGKNKKTYRSQSTGGSINEIGNSWQPHANLKEKTWWDAACVTRNGTYIQGREECYFSVDQAITWTKVNPWTEYYQDPATKLHIDIMQVREFEKSNGTPFTLICTHGGIYYTENIAHGVTNISLSGLHTSQVYDAVSLDVDPKWIFTGSQDQGWQKGRIGSDAPPVDFEQVYHGDYGHILIEEDFTLWISYPNGLIRQYNNVFSPFPETGENIPNNEVQIGTPQEKVWLSPIIQHPTSENTALVAGGNLFPNTSGSHIISLKKSDNGAIEPFQYSFDFSVSGGEISALATDPNNTDNWYVATTNGRFFYSNNAGLNFTMAQANVPGNNPGYRYATDILVSKVDTNTIYIAGSGYSNEAVSKSTDGGITFTGMSTGLPPTTVFELATNERENLIFAATEAGAYVYLRATDKWYDLTQLVGPNQIYWSVQFIEEIETARFGTYGRGVWDFAVNELLSTKQAPNLSNLVNIYPNPSADFIRIDSEFFGNISHYEVFTLNGNFIFGGEITTPLDEISISALAQGAYVMRLKHSEGYIFKKFVKI